MKFIKSSNIILSDDFRKILPQMSLSLIRSNLAGPLTIFFMLNSLIITLMSVWGLSPVFKPNWHKYLTNADDLIPSDLYELTPTAPCLLDSFFPS